MKCDVVSGTCPDYSGALTVSQHTWIGIYLISVGILAVCGNGYVLFTYYTRPERRTPTSLLLANLAVADLGMSLFGGFLLSGTSSLKGRWLFGDFGCQYYAFMGFFFGNASILCLTTIAVDRYLTVKSFDVRKTWGFPEYYRMVAIVWVSSFFWSSMPLLGWGRYNYEPSVTTCTLDYMHNDFSYKSYTMSLFVFLYGFPVMLMCYCYLNVARHLTGKSDSPHGSQDTVQQNTVTVMSMVLMVLFMISWTPYAIVCLWTVFADPGTLPFFLTVAPPLFAKMSTIVNPVLYRATQGKGSGNLQARPDKKSK